MTDEQKPGERAITPEAIEKLIPRPPRGRYSVRTPANAAVIANSLAGGATRRSASADAAIDDNTFFRWFHDSEAFRNLVIMSEAIAERRKVDVITKAAEKGVWQAAAWWLERRRPQSYGRRDRLTIDSETREMARVIAEMEGLDPAELIAEAEAVAIAYERRVKAEEEG